MAEIELAFDCVFVGFFLAFGAWVFMVVVEMISDAGRYIQDKLLQEKKK